MTPGKHVSWKRATKAITFVAACGSLLILSGCRVGPKYEQPDLMLSSHWVFGDSEVLIEGDPLVPGAWWDSFGDPVMSDLVRQAQEQNLDIQAAGLRVLQARSTKVRSIWAMVPLPVPAASWSRMNLSENVEPDVEIDKPERSKRTPGPLLSAAGDKIDPLSLPVPTVKVRDELDVYEVGAQAAWEPDLWGAQRSRVEANSALVRAALARYDGVSVIVSAEVASTYVQLRSMQEQRGALQARLEGLAKLKDSADGGNAALAASLYEDTRATIVDLDTSIEQFQNALCTLLGRTPGSLKEVLDAPGTVPVAPTRVAVGVPADLLRRRPDVRLAEREAAAQCARIGQTKARLYPSFQLLGAFGFASSDSNNLFDSDSIKHAYGIGFSWDILAYPFIQERVRIEDAQYQEAILMFQDTVTRAAQEAEDAMVGYANSLRKSEMLLESARSAEQAAEANLNGFADGGVEFGDAFTALEYEIAQRNKEIAARASSSLYMVKLYAALGGGWEVREGQSLVPPAIQEEMRERTEWSTFDGKDNLRSVR